MRQSSEETEGQGGETSALQAKRPLKLPELEGAAYDDEQLLDTPSACLSQVARDTSSADRLFPLSVTATALHAGAQAASEYLEDRVAIATRCAEDEACVAAEAHALRMLFEESSSEDADSTDGGEWDGDEGGQGEEGKEGGPVGVCDLGSDGGKDVGKGEAEEGCVCEDCGLGSSGEGTWQRRRRHSPAWWQQRQRKRPEITPPPASTSPGFASGLDRTLEVATCYGMLGAVSDHCLRIVARADGSGFPPGGGLLPSSGASPGGAALDSVATTVALKPESSAARLEPTPAASFTGADGALADALRIDGLEGARREAATRLQEHSALLSLGLGVLKQEVAALLNDVDLHVIVASRASHAEADASSASSTSSSAASCRGRRPRVAPGTNPSAADYLARSVPSKRSGRAQRRSATTR